MTGSAHLRRLALAGLAAALACGGNPQPETAPVRAQSPQPEADGSSLSPLRLIYTTTIQTQGQQVTLEQTRTLERVRLADRETWAVTEQSRSSRGSGVDSVYLDAERLAPVRRYAVGQGSRELAYSADSITGTTNYGGRETSVERAIDGPVLSGGPGLETALSAYPIGEGWSATLRTHSPQQREIHTREFRVTGTETVEVPAGEFEAFVVEATPVGGSGFEATFWVRREAPHHVVRSVRSIPSEMGGGTITKVLMSLGAVDDAPGGDARREGGSGG
jgi:hypothetical protein